MKKAVITLAVLLALSMAGNIYLFTQQQSTAAALAATQTQLAENKAALDVANAKQIDLSAEVQVLKQQIAAAQPPKSGHSDYVPVGKEPLPPASSNSEPAEIDLSGVNDATDKLLNGGSSSTPQAPPATPSRPAGGPSAPDWGSHEGPPEDEKGGDIAIGGNPTTDHGNPFDR